jgi:hypothetical protein
MQPKRKYRATPEGTANKAAASQRKKMPNHPWRQWYMRVGKARYGSQEDAE